MENRCPELHSNFYYRAEGLHNGQIPGISDLEVLEMA